MYTFAGISTPHRHTMNTLGHRCTHTYTLVCTIPLSQVDVSPLRHRPTAHPTRSSEHLSRVIQSPAEGPSPLHASEPHRAAVSGDPCPRVLRLPVCKAPSLPLGGGRWAQTPCMVGPSLASGLLRPPDGHPAAASSHAIPASLYNLP